MGSAGLFFFSLSFSWGRVGGRGWVGEYTHILREVDDLYIVLDTVHSTPPPIHGPSFSHSVAFSLDRHTHTRSITPFIFSLSLALSSTHILPIVLPRSLPRFIYRVILHRYFFSFFSFSPFSHLHSRAFMFVVFSYSATFKYRIFRNN